MLIGNISLKDIVFGQSDFYVELKNGFLKYMLKKSSKNDIPHRNKTFCNKLEIPFNEKIKASPTIISWIKFNRAIPLSKLIILKECAKISWKEIENNVISLRSGFRGSKTLFNFPIKIDRKMGSIVGHVLGDGSIDKKYKQVFYSNSNDELLKEFSNDMKAIFGVKPRIWMQRTSNFEGKTRWDKRINNIDELKKERNCGLFYPSVCGNLLNVIFNDFAIGFNKKITNNIINSPKEYKIGLIRAFYDDESHVGEKSIRLFQDRKDILEEFRRFLLEFDIIPGEVKFYIKKNKERYYFDIHRKSNLIKFRDKIGFTSSKKMNKLKKISIIKRPTMSK